MQLPLDITLSHRMLPERSLLTWAILFFLSFSALSAQADVRSCPVTLFNNELNPQLSGPRSQVRLFAWTEAQVGSAKGSWQVIPYQVDPVSKDGFLEFFKDDSFRKDPIRKEDVLIFNADVFGSQVDLRKNPLPCQASQIFQLYELDSKRFAYLANCSKDYPVGTFPFQVSFDAKANVLESANYRYRFNPDNYMLFKEIAFRDAAGNLSPIAWDSEMLIKADVKKFFTMRFDSKDIVSRLEESRLGAVANLARVSFFLRILFFKIKMSLNTDVAFFRAAGHIPMMINIPVKATDYLNAKSGVLYTWKKPNQSLFKSSEQDLPLIDPNLIGKGFKELGKAGVKHCRGSQCLFKYQMEVGGKLLSMDLGIKSELVERGFYPMYVPSVAQFQKDMDWRDDYAQEHDRTGFYFEVSGLEKGGHPWDFWMRLGGDGAISGRCPTNVFVSRIKI